MHVYTIFKNLVLWPDCFGLELSFGFAEWGQFVKQNSTSKYNFSMGCSVYGKTKFIVYELMQNGWLETQLHGKNTLISFFFSLENLENGR